MSPDSGVVGKMLAALPVLMRQILALAVILGCCLPAGSPWAHETHDASPPLRSFLTALKPDSVLQPGEVVDCTLSGGAKTQCMRFVLQALPSRQPGPWCPSTIGDGPEAGGFWVKDGKAYDVDGAFIKDLARFYDDPAWQLYDPETGEIKVTRDFLGCFEAAVPNVPEKWYNYCVQCRVDQSASAPVATFFIPIQPVPAGQPSPLLDLPGAGVALNGVRLNGPAPYDQIVKAYNVAPFDDCGGHVNPYHGYHYHFVTDCLDKLPSVEGHASQVGISVDGYGIFARLDPLGREPEDLDDCRGHSSEALGYHYHAAPVGTNAIVGCLRGELGCVSPPGTTACDATLARQPLWPPGPPGPPG